MEGAQRIALASEPGRKREGRWYGVVVFFASGQVSRKAWCPGRGRGLRNRLGLVAW